MTTTAGELRAEARTLRGLADAANPRGDGHWFARCDFPNSRFPGSQWRTRARLWTTRWGQLLGAHAKGTDAFAYVDQQVGIYIAVMNPAVGLALADLLDRTADHCAENLPCCADGVECPTVEPVLDLIAALRKARALTANGGPS
ncbi:hypothetical protein [Streptomyces spectabilis]|uniref:Uncharacterized protein n=1 Tax=Streptomyces spectabilis TaxID=68270 RepID=A0A5P2X7R0_STRST|nr:hypothetical protein [Streptomyces spectabilis]MBB5108358.1 hypothetical protein [Streptomyces spectabilis]MCI3901115.1 hypothetical protein [Streptomyces spectabilis]QEV58606.1 hypothetical protein CP982_07645 [Streptomyces spectabilis]GGV46052.1 hypothetical protein GCM10010245_72200 [Streptomyces spectabilis]